MLFFFSWAVKYLLFTSQNYECTWVINYSYCSNIFTSHIIWLHVVFNYSMHLKDRIQICWLTDTHPLLSWNKYWLDWNQSRSKYQSCFWTDLVLKKHIQSFFLDNLVKRREQNLSGPEYILLLQISLCFKLFPD